MENGRRTAIKDEHRALDLLRLWLYQLLWSGGLEPILSLIFISVLLSFHRFGLAGRSWITLWLPKLLDGFLELLRAHGNIMATKNGMFLGSSNARQRNLNYPGHT